MLALAVVSHVPNTLLSAKNSLTILCCPIMWVRKQRKGTNWIMAFVGGSSNQGSCSSSCCCGAWFRVGGQAIERLVERGGMSSAPLPKWASKPCIMGIDEAGRGPVLGTIPAFLFLPFTFACLILTSTLLLCFRSHGVWMLVLHALVPEDPRHVELCRFKSLASSTDCSMFLII